jgi:hypothetical protein
MLSNGISNIDTFSYESLGGIFEEFRLKVKSFYAAEDPNDPLFTVKFRAAQHIDGRSQQSNLAIEGGRWEPHVADRLFKQMIAATPNVHVFYRMIPTGVIMGGNRILGITAEDYQGKGHQFHGAVIIDATHEGDIAAWAGVPYSIGREARSSLEPHAGRIFYFDQTGEMLPGSTGEQDRSIPSSGYRLTVRQYPRGESALMAGPPPGYRAEDYRGADYSFFQSMPHSKSEMNVNPIGSELPGANWDWPESSPKERTHLQELYRNHALGYLYYLQHVRGQTQLGLAHDEFADNGNIPYRMFLREGRRIHGELTLTEADINPFILGRSLALPFRSDSIAVGHYPIDAKAAREKTDYSTPDKGDGDFFLANAVQPFQVPYGAIVPQKVDGLLVPVALSATHVAFSAIRMDPTWMSLGQASGVAAVLSVRAHQSVRDLSVQQLQQELLRQHCRLVFYWDVPLAEAYFQAIQSFSLKAHMDGGDRREFMPAQPLTRSGLATWIYKGCRSTSSVSNQHFSDLPWSHAAFVEVETLYDAGLLLPLGVEPQWKKYDGYSQKNFGGFGQASAFTAFHPDTPVTWDEFLGMLRLVESSSGDTLVDLRTWIISLLRGSQYSDLIHPELVSMDSVISRKQAVAVLDQFLTHHPSPCVALNQENDRPRVRRLGEQ